MYGFKTDVYLFLGIFRLAALLNERGGLRKRQYGFEIYLYPVYNTSPNLIALNCL